MNHIPDHLFKKIETISNEVKDNLRKKGIVIPVENSDGSINLGSWKVVKNIDGFYSVLDYSGYSIVEKINLPQTAIMLANTLALGKFLDNNLLDQDRKYGYALFEETLTKKSIVKRAKDKDQIELMETKNAIARAKKLRYKRVIANSFEKLRKLV